jgi:hypothetical protein
MFLEAQALCFCKFAGDPYFCSIFFLVPATVVSVQLFSEDNIEFQEKLVARSGVGDETGFPMGTPRPPFPQTYCQ